MSPAASSDIAGCTVAHKYQRRTMRLSPMETSLVEAIRSLDRSEPLSIHITVFPGSIRVHLEAEGLEGVGHGINFDSAYFEAFEEYRGKLNPRRDGARRAAPRSSKQEVGQELLGFTHRKQDSEKRSPGGEQIGIRRALRAPPNLGRRVQENEQNHDDEFNSHSGSFGRPRVAQALRSYRWTGRNS